MAVPKTFPVLVVDHEALKSFLFSVAVAIVHDRSTSVSESNELGITLPGPWNGKPLNLGVVYKSADTDWDPQHTKAAALLLYGKYLEIAMLKLQEGGPSFYAFYNRLARLKGEARASLRAKYDEIAKQNRQSDDLVWLGASMADQGRCVGTVVLATAGMFLAVSGSPAAGGAAGVYLAFKVSIAIADNGMNWNNAKAVVVGNPTLGEASIGEGSQKLIDAALEKGQARLKQNADELKTWATYLEDNVKERTRKLAQMLTKPCTDARLRDYREELASRNRVQTMSTGAGRDASRAGGSLARTKFLTGRVLPVVSWATDLVAEYSRSLTVEAEINQNR